MAQVACLTKSVTILLPKILDALSSILMIMLIDFLGRKIDNVGFSIFNLIVLGLLLGKMGGVVES